jgi:indolepyruvate ferredoxin oxidoreductase beta subunit
MSQRGGDVQSNLRLSSDPIASDLIPKGGADLIISLEPMEALRYLPYLKKDGWIVTNSVPFVNIPNYPEIETLHARMKELPQVVMLDVETLAKEAGAPLQAANMVLLGAAIPMLGLEAEKIEAGVQRIFGRKGEEVVNKNLAAIRAGMNNSIKM